MAHPTMLWALAFFVVVTGFIGKGTFGAGLGAAGFMGTVTVGLVTGFIGKGTFGAGLLGKGSGTFGAGLGAAGFMGTVTVGLETGLVGVGTAAVTMKV